MRLKLAAALVTAALVLLAFGCVERKMLIRSEPPGAPVWVDEEYAGLTPLDHEFDVYGVRRIRVGPVRDENGRAEYREVERAVEVEAPAYETFPIDFFYEVLYPGTLTDVHEIPVFKLARPDEGPPAGALEIRDKAEKFRTEARGAIPESPPAP